jgi:hypothetical protein
LNDEVLDGCNLKMGMEPRMPRCKAAIEGVECVEDGGIWTARVANMNVYGVVVK